MDDLMTSHVDPEVVTDILNSLSEKYGKMMPLTINQGEIHEYLGIIFDFSGEKDVKITMYQYIDSVIEGSPDIYKISSRETGVGIATPAPSKLYEIRNPNGENVTGLRLLTEHERKENHTLTAQCLYLSKRCRPGLQTSIAFHCTRV